MEHPKLHSVCSPGTCTKTLDELLLLLHRRESFCIIDVKKGYWHQELDNQSSLLCTFNMSFGRYKPLPFGLTISQDIFRQKLGTVLLSWA